MPLPTATFTMGTPKAKRNAAALMNEKNENFIFTGDANIAAKPKFYVKIYNVSNVEIRVERPWVNPTGRGKIIVIPACPDSERVSKPFLIPDIVQMPANSAMNWEMGTRGVDGKFLAQDALNPEDMRGNWRTVRVANEADLRNEGTNLYHWGAFWTVADEPTDEEIDTAIGRMEANYQRLIQEAELFAISGPDGVKQIGTTHRRAANYFGQSFTWNTFFKKQMACPNCGRGLPSTATRCFHDGCRKVISWEGALREGTATKEEAIAAGIFEGQVEAMAKNSGRKTKKITP
jgi:hypothetical protein